ncbi:hypothetical protein [Marinobacter salarius]|nr:hypothetical protein [Marinobacter salarius]
MQSKDKIETTTGQAPVTLYNAVDRYNMLVREMEGIEENVEALKDSAHPGVFDIHIHFSMLKTAATGAAEKFEKGSIQKLSSKDLRMLKHLEHLVFELRSIVKEACSELLPG